MEPSALLLLIAFMQAKANYNVLIRVDSNADTTKTEMVSYLSREIRSLGDATVVQDQNEANLILNVVCVDPRKPYYTAAIAVSAPARLFVQGANCDFKLIEDKQCLMNLWADVGTSLRDLAQSIVTRLDSTILEPVRKVRKAK